MLKSGLNNWARYTKQLGAVHCLIPLQRPNPNEEVQWTSQFRSPAPNAVHP